MIKRPFGQRGLLVSEIGFGCASYWGKKIMDERTALAMVHEAVDRGVNFFDTGSSYCGGHAELRLGRALATLSRRQDLVVASKAGTRIGGHGKLYKDFSSVWIEDSLKTSLKNLGLESLPILHLHGPQIADLTDDLLTSLDKLRQKGMVQALSVNSFDMPVVQHVAKLSLFDGAMIDYHILRPERRALVKMLADQSMGVFAGMALAGHLYSSRLFRPKRPQDVWYLLRALKNHRALLRRGHKMRWIEKRKDLSGAQVALNWVLQDSRVSSAVFGSTRLTHLREALDREAHALPDELLFEIERVQQRFSPIEALF